MASYWRFDEFEDLGINGDGVDDVRDFSVWTRHGDSNGNPEFVPSYLVSVDNSNATSPFGFYLFNNYPNPFNPSTRIKYSIPFVETHRDASLLVTLKVFDILGNEIEKLVNEEKLAGTYEVTWYAGQLPSGVYFYQLKAGNFIQTKKMIFLK